MIGLVLSFAGLSFFTSLVLCVLVRRWSVRAGAMDTAPIAGQVKMPSRRIPNTGGIGLFWAVAGPVLAGLVAASIAGEGSGLIGTPLEPVVEHLPGLRSQVGVTLGLLACVLLLHVLGLIDDRRPMGAGGKLVIMAVPALAATVLLNTRLLDLEALRGLSGGVPVVSVLLTAVWIVAVTNAMNFIDNMDGLSGGVGAIAGACLTAAALMSGQWFVAALSAAVCGACLGFLTQNYPRARMFMGDGGSLVVGFLLAFLATRITYILPGGDQATAGGPSGVPWYAVLMPVCVLAVPLYDFASVTGIRLSQGKSPFKGDLQHLSHRLVKRGLSKPVAVAVIWGFAVLTGLNGLLLVRAEPWEAVLHGVILIVLMGVMAAVEFGTASRAGGDEMLRA